MNVSPRCASLALAALASVGAAQAQPASDADWRRRVDALLSRWTDDPPADRLDRAAELLGERLTDDAADVAARLELARIELARDNFRAAVGAADGADQQLERRRADREAEVVGGAQGVPDAGADAAGEPALGAAEADDDEVLGRLRESRREAAAIALLAARYHVHEQLREISDPEAAASYLEGQQANLDQRREALEDVAGSEEAAASALAQEQRRRRLLTHLDRLGRPPRPIGAEDTEGEPVDLTRYSGQVVLVLFWSVELVDTTDLARRVDRIHDGLAERGVAVVGINLDEDREVFEGFVEEHDLEWRHVYAGKGWLAQDAQAWSVRSLPEGVLLDASGRVRYVNPWGSELRASVEDLLERRDTR